MLCSIVARSTEPAPLFQSWDLHIEFYLRTGLNSADFSLMDDCKHSKLFKLVIGRNTGQKSRQTNSG